MKDKICYTLNTLFKIVAVNATILLLPSAAFAASAHEPSREGGSLAPDAVVDFAAMPSCALPDPAAKSQDPPAGEGGPECQNEDGSPRECTASETLNRCGRDAVDAVRQCHKAARTFVDHGFCELGYAADIVACWNDFMEELGLPWPPVGSSDQ